LPEGVDYPLEQLAENIEETLKIFARGLPTNQTKELIVFNTPEEKHTVSIKIKAATDSIKNCQKLFS
jgi:hypothetical protein